MGSFAVPRLTMLDAGWEKGRLRREVIRYSRSRLFFRPSLLSPSTSERARRRLNARLLGTDTGRSNESLNDGQAEKVNLNVSLGVPLSR